MIIMKHSLHLSRVKTEHETLAIVLTDKASREQVQVIFTRYDKNKFL